MNIETLIKGQHFTATSPYIRDNLRKVGVRSVALIPNALPDERFRLRELTYDRSSPEMIAVNNGFSRWKNMGTLLEAFAQVRIAIPGARLRLVGRDFESDGPAQQWAANRGLDSAVVFDGPKSNAGVNEVLSKADLFVHPSLEESFGLVLVEAMSSGLPVIGGARSGAVPWVLGYGQAGILTDIRKADAIATAAVRLLEDPLLWRQTAIAGYERARAQFRVSTVVEKYLDLYRRVSHRAH